MDAETIAKAMGDGEKKVVQAAGFMVSQQWRVPWRTEHRNLAGLLRRKVIDEGGYLTPLGQQVREVLLRNA